MNPQETILDYIDRVYNEGDVQSLTEFCADPYTRHDAGSATVMTHADQTERVTHGRSVGEGAGGRALQFTTVLITADGSDVTWLWDMSAPLDCEIATMEFPFEIDGDDIWMCGVEIFRVVGGLITDVWNPPVMGGRWA